MTLTSNIQVEERVAVLLSLLGDDVLNAMMDGLPGEAGTRVNELVQQYQQDPLDDEETDEILEEFMRFFRFAAEEATNAASGESKKNDKNGGELEEDDEPFVPTDDAVYDLKQLKPYQIAGALMNENPRTITIVLNCLSPEQAGASLELLSEELQSEVFVMLRNPPNVTDSLLQRIVRTAVDKGCGLGPDIFRNAEAETLQKLADLLRAMGEKERKRMLEVLEEKDPDTFGQIKEMLYIFEDLLTIADRSVQKILGEVDTTSLAKALSGAEGEVVDKIMANLSKRAKLTLNEEIEFMGKISEEEQIEARKVVTTAMAQLDQAGELEREEAE